MKASSPFRHPVFWLWLCLSALPPDLIASATGWSIVDPANLGLLLAWWPVDALGRLMALSLLMGEGVPRGRPYIRPTLKSLPTALAAEVLVGVRAAAVMLLGLIPGIAWLSVAGLETPARWGPALGLALLGLLPGVHYLLRRLLAPILILRGESNAGRALTASASQLDGRLMLFLGAALPWLVLSWLLDLGSMALPDPWGLLPAPLGLAAGLQGLWAGWKRLG